MIVRHITQALVLFLLIQTEEKNKLSSFSIPKIIFSLLLLQRQQGLFPEL
jgi:hypothetical protein